MRPPRQISIQVASVPASGSEDPEITKLRAQIDELQTKLALYRRRRQLDLEYDAMVNADQLRVHCSPLLAVIAAEFSMTVAQLFSRHRFEALAQARFVAMALITDYIAPGLRLRDREIAALFNKERSTCAYARIFVRNRSEIDPAFAARVAKLRAAMISMPNGTC